MMTIRELEQEANQIRIDIINMISEAGSGHPGGSLSAADIMTALYFYKMHIDPADPKMADRDRFVLSKGHAAPCYYAALAERGFFPKEKLLTLRRLHSELQGHPDAKKCRGVDASTGSLGQGYSIAVGMALAEKRLRKSSVQVYTLLGDGELDEGLVWEASMAASNFQLDNLTVIVDNNGLQIDGTNDEVMALGDLAAKFSAFGFHVIDVKDGNDMKEIVKALDEPAEAGKPKLILAHTVKGKGVSFMENQVGWHGKAPNEEQRQQAIRELEGR